MKIRRYNLLTVVFLVALLLFTVQTEAQTYKYDLGGRLTGVIYTNSSKTSFNYDSAGNISSAAPNILATSASITSTKNPSGFKDSVLFTAALPSDATGTVIFKTNSVAFDTEALSNGEATSLATTLLPRGTNSITAEYAGDANYFGSTNDLSGGQIVTNHPPLTTLMTVTRTAGLKLLIALSDVATNWSDLDADTITLAGINLATTNAVTLLTNSAWILYPSSPNVPDSFSYTISDGYGGTNIGYVNILVNASVTGTNSITKIVSGQPTTLTAYGFPGTNYITERSINLTDWTPISTNAAATNGVISVIDNFTDLGGNQPSSAYYRLKWQP